MRLSVLNVSFLQSTRGTVPLVRLWALPSANFILFQLILTGFSFLSTGNYSDLAITCGGETYNVHKVVVCSRCDFFARAVKFDGKVRYLPVMKLRRQLVLQDRPKSVKFGSDTDHETLQSRSLTAT
jgi:hypothetical protein